MKHVLTISIIFQLASFPILAQTLPPQELLARGESNDLVGYTPKSLESLVGFAAIIFKGRFGEHLSHGQFFGYGESKESFIERTNSDDATADRLAIPRSDYRVLVDELLVGESDRNEIVYRIFESQPTDRRYTHPDLERLFFLVQNPDGTYSPLGPASVLTLRAGEYVYDSLTSHSNSYMNRQLDFLSDLTPTEVEEHVRAEITRQYPSN